MLCKMVDSINSVNQRRRVEDWLAGIQNLVLFFGSRSQQFISLMHAKLSGALSNCLSQCTLPLHRSPLRMQRTLPFILNIRESIRFSTVWKNIATNFDDLNNSRHRETVTVSKICIVFCLLHLGKALLQTLFQLEPKCALHSCKNRVVTWKLVYWIVRICAISSSQVVA